MFNNNQLASIVKSLEFSISQSEKNLGQYNDFLSISEKKALRKQIDEYGNVMLSVKNYIGNKEIIKYLR